jgi:hypothetical protein
MKKAAKNVDCEEHNNVPCHSVVSSWQNIQFLPFHNTPIHLISPLLTYFYSLNSKLPLKEENFRQWNTSSLMQQMTNRQYHKHSLDSASTRGKGCGRCSLLCKGTILKVVIFSKL